MTQLLLPAVKADGRDAARVPESLSEVFDPALARGERAAVRGKLTEYVIVALVVGFLAGYEWLRWVMRAELHPIWMTLFAFCIALYCLARVWWLSGRLRALQSGQGLWDSLVVDFSELGERGYYLFDGIRDMHGLPMGPVLVGPTGVFSLTVRTSPPTGRPFEKADHVDRHKLRLGGRPAFADPLGGARRMAQRVSAVLVLRGAGELPVVPMVVLPGWRMGSRPAEDARDVLVVSEETLAREVLNQPGHLEPKAILEVCEALRPAA
ncbi:MAG: hypothetical protein ACKV19_21260 [Verrucomicrobiales bacterium]